MTGDRCSTNAPHLLVLVLSLFVFACGRPGELPESMRVGIRAGNGRFQKRLLYDVKQIGQVTDIQRGSIRSDRVEVGIAGGRGACFYDSSGNLAASVDFPEARGSSNRIVRHTGATPLLFLHQESPVAGSDGVLDEHGHLLWQTAYPCVNSTFAYTGAGGAPEFIFARRDASLEARDSKGTVEWRLTDVGWAFSIAVAGAPGSRNSRILVSADQAIAAVSMSGALLYKRRPPVDGYVGDFLPLDWPPICTDGCILCSARDHMFLISGDLQRVVMSLGPGFVSDGRVATVKLEDGTRPFLALSTVMLFKSGRTIAQHSAIYFFSPEGKLVYHEVVREQIRALCAVPATKGKGESLLAGGEGRVWEYYSSRGE